MSMNTKHFLIFLIVISSYFIINQLNYDGQIYDLGINLDNKIPLITWFVYFYLVYFVLILIPFFKSNDTKKITLQYCIAVIISAFFFIFLPTAIYRPLIENINLNNILINYIHILDKPYNLFPSLHASLLTLAFIFLLKHEKNLAYKLSPLFILSLVSTLFIKQHYILDLAGGILIAFIAVIVANKFEKVI